MFIGPLVGGVIIILNVNFCLVYRRLLSLVVYFSVYSQDICSRFTLLFSWFAQ